MLPPKPFTTLAIFGESPYVPGSMDAPRLSPEFASRKLQVLAFVRRYLTEHGGSPSYGEIAAGCGTTRRRVREHVHTLLREGRLIRIGGTRRALALPGAAPVPARPAGGSFPDLSALCALDHHEAHGGETRLGEAERGGTGAGGPDPR